MPFHPPKRGSGRPSDDPLAELLQPISGVMKIVRKVGATLIEKGAAIWEDPAKAVALAEQGGALTAEVAKLALMPQDSPTRFKGKPGVAKEVAWAAPLSLDDVKTVAKALGASVNDVLLSCVAGALAGYLARKGELTDGVMIRALVPVNLRPIEEAYRLGNQFGLVFLELPIGIDNPVERLYAVRANMRALKGSFQPVIALGLLAAMGAGPQVLQEELLHALARNGTAVMTNVPGPPQKALLRRRRRSSASSSGSRNRAISDGGVDPFVCRPGAVRADHRPRAVPGSRRDQQALRPGAREAAARHAARAVAARRRSRPGGGSAGRGRE
jgi:hypothetical protein